MLGRWCCRHVRARTLPPKTPLTACCTPGRLELSLPTVAALCMQRQLTVFCIDASVENSYIPLYLKPFYNTRFARDSLYCRHQLQEHPGQVFPFFAHPIGNCSYRSHNPGHPVPFIPQRVGFGAFWDSGQWPRCEKPLPVFLRFEFDSRV